MFIDNEIIRFKNGVNNRAQGNIFNSIPVPDRTVFSEYCNDFLSFNRVITTEPNGSIEGVWNTGTLFGAANVGSILYFAGNQGLQGKLLCTTGATLNDDLNIQFNGRPAVFARGKRVFFKVIISLETANVPLVNIGFFNGGSSQNPTNGVWWEKAAGSSAFDLRWARFSTFDALGLTNQPALVNEDDIELSFYYDGEDGIWGGINGQALGRGILTDLSFPYGDTAGNMAPFIYIQNGAASAQRIDIDFIYWAQERSQTGIEI